MTRFEINYAKMAGAVYGSYTFLGVVQRRKYKGYDAIYFRCICQCGIEQWVYSGNLVNGNSTQCRQCATDGMRNGQKSYAETRVQFHRNKGCNTLIENGRMVTLCLNCDKRITNGYKRCSKCAPKNKPRKYNVSIGTIARKANVSRQAIHAQIKKYGFEFVAIKYGYGKE